MAPAARVAYGDALMWKHAIFLVLLVVMGPSAVQALTDKSPVSKEAVRQAIADFREDPTSEKGRGARGRIIQFSHDSEDVLLNISSKVLPWMENDRVDEDTAFTLFSAFAAGNTLAQLDKGKKEDDTMAGVAQIIATYRQLQKAKPSLKISEVDRLIDLQNEGKLAAFLEEP